MIVTADVLDWARDYDGPAFHAVLCDPPYELAFMGKHWDAAGVAFSPDTWSAIASHVHPGGFIMAFGGSRTYHRLACAMEDAGLIVHPAIGWAQGSGFPKATRVKDAPAFEGHRYGLQALKPAFEFIAVAQVPYKGKPVECITTTGAGALWIDGGRVATGETVPGGGNGQASHGGRYGSGETNGTRPLVEPHTAGRWPPNLALCHSPDCRRVGERRVRGSGWSQTGSNTSDNACMSSRNYARDPKPDAFADSDGLETVAAWECSPDCPVAMIGAQSGERASGVAVNRNRDGGPDRNPNGVCYGAYRNAATDDVTFPDHGTAARFFPNPDWSLDVAESVANADSVRYCAKASRRERNAGMPDGERCSHPTVKPLALCRWLATLLLPPDAYAPRRILVPFAGSGSEAIGAMLAGWDEVVAVEREPEYVAIAEARMAWWEEHKEPAQLELAL